MNTASRQKPAQAHPIQDGSRAPSPDKQQDKQKEITFFDNHAAADSYDVFAPESSALLVRTSVELGQFKSGHRVADLGCGSGVFTDLLRQHGCIPTGLDISPKLIELGRRKYPD